MRTYVLVPLLLLGTISFARAESSNLVFGPVDFPVLEAISRSVPGFAGFVRSVSREGRPCLRPGSVFSSLTQQTVTAVQRSGRFDPDRICPDVEVVTHSLRTLMRVAREVQGIMPEVQVQVDTGLNRVLVSDLAAVTAELPDLARFLVGVDEIPAYTLMLDLNDEGPTVTITNPLKRRIAVEPFCGAPVVQVWKGSQLLSTRPDVTCALSGAPEILRPGEQLVLKAVPSTPLNTLERGTYTLRVKTDDQSGRQVEQVWTKP